MLKLRVEGIMLSQDCTSLILQSVWISAPSCFRTPSLPHNNATQVLLCALPSLEAATCSVWPAAHGPRRLCFSPQVSVHTEKVGLLLVAQLLT